MKMKIGIIRREGKEKKKKDFRSDKREGCNIYVNRDPLTRSFPTLCCLGTSLNLIVDTSLMTFFSF